MDGGEEVDVGGVGAEGDDVDHFALGSLSFWFGRLLKMEDDGGYSGCLAAFLILTAFDEVWGHMTLHYAYINMNIDAVQRTNFLLPLVVSSLGGG